MTAIADPQERVAAQLPVVEALPRLLQALAENPNGVLVAPPGAGKTTMVPLALLREASWVSGRIVKLAPRRRAGPGGAPPTGAGGPRTTSVAQPVLA